MIEIIQIINHFESQRLTLFIAKTPPKPSKKEDFKGYVYCPNKVNMFHICSVFCETNWRGHSTPDPAYARSMQKLLFKHPLPSNWIEVFDKGV